MTPEQIGLWAGLVLTLMVFSYLLGDNVLYRLAVFIFVGLAAGFVTVVTVENVILPWFRDTTFGANSSLGLRIVGVVPLVLGLLLLVKSTVRLGRFGNVALAFVIGIGTAVSIVGALAGTLLPLTASAGATMQTDLLNGFLLVLGVICSLVYFQSLARRAPGGEIRQGLPTRVFGGIGKGFIVVALAALYGGAILTGLTIFGERLAFILARVGGG
jgi:hypothetical protein